MPQRLPLPPAATVRSTPPPLDARLRLAASFARGGRIADIGTDHAYLPAALLLEGKCTFAVASDIHRGPAAVAAEHLSSFGIRDRDAAVLLTDGLDGVQEYQPADIFILGMGGEMIAGILSRAPWIASPTVRLILQPMTRFSALRAYLDRNGFCIREDRLVKTDRIYQVLCAEYDGIERRHSPLALLVGEGNLARRDPLCMEYVEKQKRILESAKSGKQSVGADTAAEDALLGEIRVFLSESTDRKEVSTTDDRI